jgi:hypothetical protein
MNVWLNIGVSGKNSAFIFRVEGSKFFCSIGIYPQVHMELQHKTNIVTFTAVRTSNLIQLIKKFLASC